MAERPILFSAPMVRANRAGLKWQTRRLMKPAKCKDTGAMLAPCEIAGEINGGDYRLAPCAPGDVLWVREAFYIASVCRYEFGIGYRADHPTGSLIDGDGGYGFRSFSDNPEDAGEQWNWAQQHHGTEKWIPSIHMPRWACRDTYTVLSVRAERLQDITEADAITEGVQPWPYNPDQTLTSGERAGDSPYRAGFALLWDELNDERATWKSNRFVWVIEYENPARKLVDAQEGK